MEKKQLVRIVIWSSVALVIPILGQLLVAGWNWGLGDFVFAWIFFNVLGVTYTFVTNKITSRLYRALAGMLVIGVFVFIWVTLATG